jgi:tRNA(adenine34) deaminase
VAKEAKIEVPPPPSLDQETRLSMKVMKRRMSQWAEDEELMRSALRLAREGLDSGDPPIGALVALDGDVIASTWRRVGAETVLDHSEVVVLRTAVSDSRLRARRRDAVLYTTLEPCLMCMGTAMFFRVRRIVYALEAVADGASDVAEFWQPDVGHPPPGSYLYDVPEVTGGVCRDQALTLFRQFAEQNPDVLWAQALVPDFARAGARRPSD